MAPRSLLSRWTLLAGCVVVSALCAQAAGLKPNMPDDDPSTVADRGASNTGKTLEFNADQDWKPIQWEPMKIVKGSALDFSGFNEAPAGKWGELVAKDGRFVFKNAPEKAARFYGVNVTHGLPFVDKARCEQLTDFLAASGYNLVRFHNYTYKKGVMKEDGATEFTPQAQDQFDYLFYCLKQRGIYYTFPIDSWGFFKAGDITDIPEFKDRALRMEFRGLLPHSDDAMNWLKTFATNLLGHTNPYTGIALKDDPALVGLEIANEDPLFMVFKNNPAVQPVYRRICAEQLKARDGAEPTQAQVEAALPVFILESQEKLIKSVKDFFREAGIQKPITDVTVTNNMIYAIPRSQLDYVDIHQYWALYKRLPGEKAEKGEKSNFFPYRQSWVNPNKVGWDPSLSAVTGRIFGLPYMCGEFNSAYATPYWIFTGPMEAIFAAQQGWTSVARYAQAAQPENAFKPSVPIRVESGPSPIMMFSERIGSILFAQGEVHPLPNKVPLLLTPEYLKSKLNVIGGPGYPTDYRGLAFQYQLGTVLWNGKDLPAGYAAWVTPPDMKIPDALKNQQFVHSDAELKAKLKAAIPAASGSPSPLRLDTKSGAAQIVTPRSETFLLPAEQKNASGQLVSLTGNATVAVAFAGSLDPKPLSQSERILVLYLTDLKGTGTKVEFEEKENVIVRNYGKLPLLVHDGKIMMNFHMKGRALPKVWALKFDGSRATEVLPRATADGFAFEVRALTAPDVFAAYEVAWNKNPAQRR